MIGHISKMSILEAWNSENPRKLREQMIHDRSKIKVCKLVLILALAVYLPDLTVTKKN